MNIILHNPKFMQSILEFAKVYKIIYQKYVIFTAFSCYNHKSRRVIAP